MQICQVPLHSIDSQNVAPVNVGPLSLTKIFGKPKVASVCLNCPTAILAMMADMTHTSNQLVWVSMTTINILPVIGPAMLAHG